MNTVIFTTRTVCKEKKALYLGSTVVEHSTHNPKVEGTNPATGTRREKIEKINHWQNARWWHKKLGRFALNKK
jgi:hypothetical protein